MPSQNTTVRRLNLAAPSLDLHCLELVTNSGEILITGNSHKKKLEGLLPEDDVEVYRSVILNKCVVASKLLAEIQMKGIPSIFKDESTGSCICLWKLAVAAATYVSICIVYRILPSFAF
jgi:hypothetical protein